MAPIFFASLRDKRTPNSAQTLLLFSFSGFSIFSIFSPFLAVGQNPIYPGVQLWCTWYQMKAALFHFGRVGSETQSYPVS